MHTFFRRRSVLPAIAVAALILTLGAALPQAGTARAETAPPMATITVTGEASTEAVPDLATLSIGVTTVGETAAAALEANSAALRPVIERLKAVGIEDRDMQTSGLSLNPNWDSRYSGASSADAISGYTATNLLTVRIRALGSLGQVLDTAVADGANTLNGLSFGLADPRPALDEARKAAVIDARAKAELIAAAAGVALGRVVSIAEGGGQGAPLPMYRAETAMAAVPVQQGEVSYSASVTIVYEIAP